MVFQQKLLGKAFFVVKMTSPAMVWPVSYDKWKAPKNCFGGEIDLLCFCLITVNSLLSPPIK